MTTLILVLVIAVGVVLIWSANDDYADWMDQ